MADSLVLKGVKDVRKHTGTEMLLTNPRRGVLGVFGVSLVLIPPIPLVLSLI